MTFKFFLIQTLPILKPDWFCLVSKKDQEMIAFLHSRMSAHLFTKTGKNPHLVDEKGEPKNFYAGLQHPIVLGAAWLNSILRFTLKYDKVFLNRVGGMLILNNQCKILGEQESEKFIFPPKTFNNEIITITKWPDGNHFYLKSNYNRIFPQKCNTAQEAEDIAKKIAPDAKIVFKC